MKIVFVLAAMVVLLVMLIPGSPADACWVYLTTEDLVKQSDVIAIGEIKGIAGTEKVGGMWVTHWNVEVHYYLAGNLDRSVLTVTTPGARNKEPMISTYYPLNEWGHTVLLFLTEREGRLEPPSPQGVVALSANDLPAMEALTGRYLLEEYTIVDQRVGAVEREALEDYLAGLTQVTPAPESAENTAGGLTYNRYIFPAALLLLVLGVGLVVNPHR